MGGLGEGITFFFKAPKVGWYKHANPQKDLLSSLLLKPRNTLPGI